MKKLKLTEKLCNEKNSKKTRCIVRAEALRFKRREKVGNLAEALSKG